MAHTALHVQRGGNTFDRRRRLTPASLRRAALALVAFLVGAIALVNVSATAQAAELQGAIKTVTITRENDGALHTYDQVQINATWAAPVGAVAGDTFSLAFPTDPALVASPMSLTLMSPDGLPVADCTVTEAGFSCTLTDYVTNHSDVTGNLSFTAQFTTTSTKSQVEFVAGDKSFIVDLPSAGGVEGPADLEYFKVPTKYGWVAQIGDDAGKAVWHIFIPTADMVDADGNTLLLTDTIDPRLTADTDSIQIDFIKGTDWNNGAYGNSGIIIPRDAAGTSTATSYTFTPGPAANQFQIKINNPQTVDGLYHITYFAAVPTDAVTGTIFTNEIAGASQWTVPAGIKYQGASGDGSGINPRSITLTKKVDGPAPTGNFTFSVDCTVDGTSLATFPRPLTLAADESATIDSVPVGSVCNITETDSLGADSVTYTDSSTVTVTKDSPAAINVVATNHFVTPMNFLGGLSVTKAVTGDVPTGTEYTVNYSYDRDGNTITGTLTVLAGATATLDNLPVGTVVTLTEPTIPAVTGSTWAAPAFTIVGDTATPTPTIDVTVEADTTVAVNLTNTATPIPVGLGSVSVTKTVTGDGVVPADTKYTVNYSYVLDGTTVTGTLPVLAGATATLDNLAVGTVVTLTEPMVPAVDGATWGAPAFTIVGSSEAPTSTIDVTIAADTTAVNLTNTATPIPVGLGSIAVTKTVTGPAASLVPTDTAYAVAYSYTLDGHVVTGTLSVLAGATATLDNLPVGTVVTFTEPAIPTVTNVQWGTPTFTVASVTTPTTVTVTVTAGATAVAVTNTATRTPVSGVLSTSGTAPTGAYTLPSSSGLAMTGASPLAALLTAAGLAIAGIALVAARRTRSER